MNCSGSDSYSGLATVYDVLTANVNYAEVADFLHGIIKTHGNGGEILVDLCCGTGTFSELMAQKGYDVIGVDISEEMLNIALDKKFDTGLPVQYLKQDVTELDLYGTCDIFLCMLDALNHLLDISQVEKVFERVSLFSNPNALFIFDVNTIHKHKNVLHNKCFFHDSDEIFVAWESVCTDVTVVHSFNIFVQERDTCYSRYTTTITEKAYEIDWLVVLLKQYGFTLLGTFDGFSDIEANSLSERVLFVAQKLS
jgi:ubiquinone/menaquinone biosynthesis C-methylase UbiE